MRILLLADIHANWPALRAFAALEEPHDLCLVLGDLVDYGLDPVPCIEWVQEHAHYTIRGNHDHAVAQRAVTNGAGGFKYLSGLTRVLTWEKLNPGYLRYLGGLPVSYLLTLDGTRFLLVHATPRDPLDEYAPADAEFWARRLERVQADVVCVGHTHQPYVLPVGDKLVINPGSIGQPRDGDPRACYAIWDNGQVELKRVSYPVEETVKSIEASRLPEQAKQLSIEIYRHGMLPRPGGNHVQSGVAVLPPPATQADTTQPPKPVQVPADGEETAAPIDELPSSIEVALELEAEDLSAGERSVEHASAVDSNSGQIDLEPPREADPSLSEHRYAESTAAAAEGSPVADTHPQFGREERAAKGKEEPSSGKPPQQETDMAETLPGPFDFRFDWGELGIEPPEKKPDDPGADRGKKRPKSRES